jgi:protein O-mannosyl-transferase
MNSLLQGRFNKLRHPLFLLATMVVVAILIYVPGLSGDFAFDDNTNILINDHLRVESFDYSSLGAAAFSGDAGPLKRPISMLSFAFNYYFTGFDPLYFKIVNLSIHLLNGVSLYLFLSLLFGALARQPDDTTTPNQRQYLCLAITAAWLVHPLTLTSVLYVVQRMNSLAVLFTLWGLVSYLWGRLQLDRGKNKKGFVWMVVGIFGFGLLASLCKENGLLLPLYAVVIEGTVFRFRTSSASNRRMIYGLIILTIALPILIASAYLALHQDWLLNQYRIRTFTLAERLMTESRVLWLYLKWIFIPNNAELGLFHDDILISTGLSHPLTTLFSILGSTSLLFSAFVLRNRIPLLAFGVFWFFAGHTLESSFLGLEIAHEHRNYLPMVGILLIAFNTLYAICKNENLVRVRTGVTVTFIALLCIVTSMRAIQWNSNISLNLTEVEHHPDSVRANYQAGRQYTILFEQDTTSRHFYDKAWYYLDRAANLDRKSTVGLFGLIALARVDHHAPDPMLLADLRQRLSTSFFGAYEMLALKKLAATDGLGKPDVLHEDVLALFDAALENPYLEPGVKGMLFSSLSAYYANQRHAYPDAIALAFKAIEVAPNEAIFNASLADLLYGFRQFDGARVQIEIAKEKDHLGRFASEISALEIKINHHD